MIEGLRYRIDLRMTADERWSAAITTYHDGGNTSEETTPAVETWTDAVALAYRRICDRRGETILVPAGGPGRRGR